MKESSARPLVSKGSMPIPQPSPLGHDNGVEIHDIRLGQRSIRWRSSHTPNVDIE